VPPQPQYVPPQPQYIPPQPQYVPPQPQYAPQEPQFVPPQLPPLPAQAQYTISEERRGMPGWMVALMAAALLGGLLYVAYKYLLPGHNTATASQTAGAEKAVVPGSTSSHPYAKFLEVSALRLAEEKGKPKLMYTVVNHSGGELAGVELKITLRPTTAKPEDAPIATFVSKVGSLGPYEAKDMSTIIETKERAYELPDWQFLHADFDVTAPK
jgi:hypothetical protein